MQRKSQPAFSQDLERWLTSRGRKTLAGLNQLFGEKTFAIAWLLLMALPALPLPTGGITHVTEIITMLLSLELIIGRRTVWVPKRWEKMDIGKIMRGKAATKLIGFIVWFEKFSRHRWSALLTRRPVLSALGIVVLIFTVAAFVAPPFSGLDTLPALGVVVISLALVLEDSLLVLVGFIIGVVGIGLEIAAGTALYDGVKHLFHYV